MNAEASTPDQPVAPLLTVGADLFQERSCSNVVMLMLMLFLWLTWALGSHQVFGSQQVLTFVICPELFPITSDAS